MRYIDWLNQFQDVVIVEPYGSLGALVIRPKPYHSPDLTGLWRLKDKIVSSIVSAQGVVLIDRFNSK